MKPQKEEWRPMPECRYGYALNGRQVVFNLDKFRVEMLKLWIELKPEDRQYFLNFHCNLMMGVIRHICTWENLLDATKLFLHCGLDLYNATMALDAIGLFYDHGFTLPRWGRDRKAFTMRDRSRDVNFLDGCLCDAKAAERKVKS